MPTANTDECSLRRRIAALTSKTNLLMALLSHAEENLAQRDADLALRAAEIRGRDEELARLRGEIQQRDKDLAVRAAEIERRDEELSRLHSEHSAKLRETVQQLLAAEHKMEELLKSTSWRMTIPLRALRRSLTAVLGSRRTT